MTQIDDTLMPNEKIILRGQIHEAAVFGPLIAIVVIAIIAILFFLMDA